MMYNLIISGNDEAWESEICEMSLSRLFEYTDRPVKELFGRLTPEGQVLDPDISYLKKFPAVLAYEKGINKPARVVQITAIQQSGDNLRFRYRTLAEYIAVASISEDPLAFDLGIDSKSRETTRSHWAVKDVDLRIVWPKDEVSSQDGGSAIANMDERTIFVVHGHDEAAKLSVARFLERAGLDPIILSERSDQGRTIIEKFVAHAGSSGFAVILMTPDDVGGTDQQHLRPRARQSVILELGYFIALLGRHRVCALRKGDVEIPSDFLGVVYKDFDNSEGWKLSLWRELQQAGYKLDQRALG